jgi:GTPase involved in cell partitioning and DNA repair
VVAKKLDATTDRTKLDELEQFCKKKGLAFHAISAAAVDGVKELVRGMADALDKIPKEELEEEEEAASELAEVTEDDEAEVLDEADEQE